MSTVLSLPILTLCELADPGLPHVESYSPFCLKIHRALKLAQLPYERRLADRPDAHKRLNPLGQVPVLLVADEAVFDSTAILHRIEQLAPGRLQPELTARQRADAWLWEEFADTTLNGFLVAARWADDRNWPLTREAYFSGMPIPVKTLIPRLIRRRVVGGLHARDVWRAGGEVCWQRFLTVLDDLEAHIAGQRYWLGDVRTVADLAVFGQLHSLRTPLTPWQGAELAKRRELTAWLDRIDAETVG